MTKRQAFLTVLCLLAGLTAHAADWPQWGGSSARNNTPVAKDLPTDWSVGEFDFDTGKWIPDDAENIKWVAKLGSQTYGNPVIAGGRVYIGTNNEGGYSKRIAKEVDLGVLLCVRESDGKFLWQHSNPKLKAGSEVDWPHVGVCSSPLVEGNRLWYVTNRCEVVCLDVEGFANGNDGVKDEPSDAKDEADVVWRFDMIDRLGVHPHNMSNCSVTGAGDLIYVCTSNGTDEDDKVVKPDAPSFIAINKTTGKLVWESSADDAPGKNILHGQWSSPAYVAAKVGDKTVPQVIFPGGDGWLYSFHATEHNKGVSKLLWKCDLNDKAVEWDATGSGDRNNIIATPVISDGLIYIATGQDPEHGDGQGALYCIDPDKATSFGGDVSQTVVVKNGNPVAARREQNLDKDDGESEKANPHSAVIWRYTGLDANGDGKIKFEEQMHRALANSTIKDGLLFIADYSGLMQCIDAKTGKVYWTHDLLSIVWGSCLVADGKVYVGDEDGVIHVFAASKEKKLIAEPEVEGAVHGAPVVANGVLYIATPTHLFAIENK